FLGYLHENKIRPSLNKRGWFETKDLGVFANQELAIKGRLDNLFISGGENIQPEEVEEALLKYPGILEAIVVPKTHPEFDNEPIGFIRV
ncbi:o-succinylbenzoate--CoA ligase, partial [Klebsiella pneumoniae]